MVNFPGVPTGAFPGSGALQLLLLCGFSVLGLLLPDVLNALKIKDPPDENQSSSDVKEAKSSFSKE